MAMKNPTKTYRLALIGVMTAILCIFCLLYTSDAADE